MKINWVNAIMFAVFSITYYWILMAIWQVTKRFECAVLMGIAFICVYMSNLKEKK